ncbi:MAG: hypothetical protein LW701_11430 [Fluviicola sp.]|jgi:hypothetical protein|nr:hypothetical protein [Fluviicola sp.]
MANLKPKINYLNKDFDSIRKEIVDILKVYYPDQFQDFNVTSIGMSLVDLLAYVGDILSYNTDKRFNELFIDGVSEREAVFRLAKTFGYRPVGNRPAVSIVDITVGVPTTANGPNTAYLPIFRPGVQAKGNGQVFETFNEIDFGSDFSATGVPNRIVSPVFNSNQDIIRYDITKREVVKAGTTLVYKKEISTDEAATSFYEILLPETNVLEVVSVINKPGTGYVTVPTYQEFNDYNLKYYEVDYLAQSQVFVEDTAVLPTNGVYAGKWLDVPQRFIKEYMSNGRHKITFGGGTNNNNAYENYLTNFNIYDTGLINISDVLNNDSLGTRLLANSTLFVQYRIGGGSLSNVGAGALTNIANISAVFGGNDQGTIQNILATTTINNPLPGYGGAEPQSVDEIKFYISSNYAAQDRCVTLSDYISRVNQIPGKFGAPFRTWGKVEDNKVKLYIITKNADGKLANTSNTYVKNNILNYLKNYRMVNDFVEINDGQIVNLQIEADLYIDKQFNSNEIKLAAITAIKEFMDVNKWTFNQNIYISQITDTLREIPGVINVVDIRAYNMEGGNYSSSLITQAIGPRLSVIGTSVYKTEIEFVDNTIFGNSTSMFEIKFPDGDIKVRVA